MSTGQFFTKTHIAQGLQNPIAASNHFCQKKRAKEKFTDQQK